MDNQELKQEREELKQMDLMSYSPEHFPGSAPWRTHQSHVKALTKFDATHPEIVAEIISAENKKTVSWI